MATTKTEGFSIPGVNHHPSRPSIASIHRPFSDGSMTVDTDLLTSLMSSPHTNTHESRGQYNNMASPFNFSQSLPIRHHSFDYSMPSPLSTSINVAEHLRNSSLYGAPVKFGNEHPEPPINFSSTDVPDGQRSRSQSTSNVGKAPSSRSRQSRKSMTDVRPPRGSIQRGRSQGPGTGKPMGLGVDLETHVEGELTDSISPPDFGANSAFGLAIPHHDSINTDSGSWGSGSVPGMVPGSLGSYDNDEVIVESPVTPVKSLPHLPVVDDSYKKQRRRECHNLVEKRRREHINAKIEELNTLLPEKYNQAVDQADDEEEEADKATKKKKKRGANNVSKAQKDAAHCKGRILTQSVNYIRELRETTDAQAGRIAHLEAVISSLGISGETIQNASGAAQNFNQSQNPLFWLNNQHDGGGTFDNSGHQLQAMRPSPEPADRPFSFEIPAEKPWSAHHEYMPFQPSPSGTDQSSGASVHPGYPFSSLRRMSHSTNSDMDADTVLSPLDDGDRGRPKGRGVRQDSQAELQMGMSGLFSGHGQGRDASTGSIW
ncbi:hypothetical protein IAR50_005453 [Cryptococcus sp. DSM 104548]